MGARVLDGHRRAAARSSPPVVAGRNPALAELNGVWALGTTLYTVGINSNFLELARRVPW